MAMITLCHSARSFFNFSCFEGCLLVCCRMVNWRLQPLIAAILRPRKLFELNGQVAMLGVSRFVGFLSTT